MSKEKRLGRGLEALLGSPLPAPQPPAPQLSAAAPAASTPTQASDQLPAAPRVSVYDIEANPYQPRRDFDEAEIDSLADSLQEHGLLQPVVVRRVEERYQLVAGERRLRAAIKAGWADVPVQVIEADDRQTAELAIVENLQRKDLNALEKAASFQRYLETYGCTQEELARRLRLDRSTIANLIRLLELPDAVRQAVRSGEISQGHARALLSLGDEQEQVVFCGRIVSEGLSVRAIEGLVQETVRSADAGTLSVHPADATGGRSAKSPSAHVGALEQELRTALGTKVDIRQTAKGRGRIVVHFSSHDEFERLREFLSDARPRRVAVG
jgi:ParB family transcriptional regulator, chromosome partitioning protein